MKHERILALSSSRVGNGGYLENAMPAIKNFLGEKALHIAFIPFAFVDENKEPLVKNVQQAFSGLPHTIQEVTLQNCNGTVENADAIMVSGGNTFKLLHDLYSSGILQIIKEKVKAGTPYIGWSAGANITGATICTTNDMPVIEPESFKALGFFPFQINPHYYNVVIEGHNGETRDQRLTEFVKLNPTAKVVCLPEGTALLYEKEVLKFIGITPGTLMKNVNSEMQKAEIVAGEDITYLM